MGDNNSSSCVICFESFDCCNDGDAEDDGLSCPSGHFVCSPDFQRVSHKYWPDELLLNMHFLSDRSTCMKQCFVKFSNCGETKAESPAQYRSVPIA